MPTGVSVLFLQISSPHLKYVYSNIAKCRTTRQPQKRGRFGSTASAGSTASSVQPDVGRRLHSFQAVERTKTSRHSYCKDDDCGCPIKYLSFWNFIFANCNYFKYKVPNKPPKPVAFHIARSTTVDVPIK